jgi:hypothetical protein
MQAARRPFSRAAASAGKSNAARMAMMAMTTRSSIKVKAAVFAALGLRPVPTQMWINLILLSPSTRVNLR